MTVLNIAPTRNALLQLQSRLSFAIEGYTILDKKREALSVELLSVVAEAEALQQQVWNMLEQAYRKLEIARLTMGQEGVEWAARAATHTVDVEILSRGTMGVALPEITSISKPDKISYSLGDTTVELDEAMAAFRDLVEQIPELTELETKVWRLARELKKTQRRAHALERIFIPNYQETIKFIQNTLEEQEREEIVILKWLKSNKEKAQKQI